MIIKENSVKEDEVLTAYNDHLIEIEMEGDESYVSPVFVSDNENLNVKVYPFDGVSKINLKSPASTLINRNNFDDEILEPDYWLKNDPSLFLRMEIGFFSNRSSFSRFYKFIKAVAQLPNYNDKRFFLENNLNLLGNNQHVNEPIYATYYDGYPFDLSFFKSSYGKIKIRNLSLDVSWILPVNVEKYTNRLFLSTGNDNIVISNDLPMRVGYNELQFEALPMFDLWEDVALSLEQINDNVLDVAQDFQVTESIPTKNELMGTLQDSLTKSNKVKAVSQVKAYQEEKRAIFYKFTEVLSQEKRLNQYQLIPNSNFKYDLHDWDTKGTIQRVQEDKFGSQVASIVSGRSEKGIRPDMSFSGEFTYSIWYKTDDSADSILFIPDSESLNIKKIVPIEGFKNSKEWEKAVFKLSTEGEINKLPFLGFYPGAGKEMKVAAVKLSQGGTSDWSPSFADLKYDSEEQLLDSITDNNDQTADLYDNLISIVATSELKKAFVKRKRSKKAPFLKFYRPSGGFGYIRMESKFEIVNSSRDNTTINGSFKGIKDKLFESITDRKDATAKIRMETEYLDEHEAKNFADLVDSPRIWIYTKDCWAPMTDDSWVSCRLVNNRLLEKNINGLYVKNEIEIEIDKYSLKL